MDKLILVLLVLVLAATYAVRIKVQTMKVWRTGQDTYNVYFGIWSTFSTNSKLQIKDNEASLHEMCELCFWQEEISTVQLKEDEGFDWGENHWLLWWKY